MIPQTEEWFRNWRSDSAIGGMIAEGSTIEELLEGYPFLERNDIRACLI
jgi:uncharacterized protein (DUF433 family)